MRKNKKSFKKKRLNLFTTLFLLLIISGSTLFLSQQLTQKQTIKSNAATTCNTPGGCGGNCNPSLNNGCGYGGCRYWEYCADENHDGIPSCYDTTNLGKNLPDYSKACGTAKANQTSVETTTIPTPTFVQNTNKPTNTPIPNIKSSCNNPAGCGGNCNPSLNSGCGYGGCRFWEYCADENGDGVPSCYDTTNNGKAQPNFSKACGYDKTSASQPSPTLTSIPKNTPIPTTKPTITPKPSTVSQNNPTSTPVPTAVPPTPKPTQTDGAAPVTNSNGYYDLTKLCIPLQINGSQADKMDMLIIPLNFTKSERTNGFYSMAATAVNSFNETNLPNDVKRKMNWYILDIDNSGFNQSLLTQYDTSPNANDGDVLAFGMAARYCGRDRFMIISKRDNAGGDSYIGIGGLLGYASIDEGIPVFAHEWGHIAGNLIDEYDYHTNRHTRDAPNCATDAAPNTPKTDPCPEDYPGYSASNTCTSQANDPAYKTPCPQWDCSKIHCSDRAKQLLANAGCYKRCENGDAYRASANSIMSTVTDVGSNLYSGPALVNIIESAFALFK